jgi:hypothetical protein
LRAGLLKEGAEICVARAGELAAMVEGETGRPAGGEAAAGFRAFVEKGDGAAGGGKRAGDGETGQAGADDGGGVHAHRVQTSDT